MWYKIFRTNFAGLVYFCKRRQTSKQMTDPGDQFKGSKHDAASINKK